MRKLKLPAAALIVAGLAAATFSFARAQSAPEADCQGQACSECDCFAPDVCGDTEVVCPAGPDCFMPEVCADRTVVCPPCEPEQDVSE